MLLIGTINQILNAQTGWVVIPSPTEETLYDITYHSFTASEWVAGANGTLIKTPIMGKPGKTLTLEPLTTLKEYIILPVLRTGLQVA